MVKLASDLEKLTTIPEKSLDKLFQRTTCCICNAVEESLLAEEDITEIDLGFGILKILVKDNEIKYKFVPSAKLNDSIVATITNGHNTLTVAVEAALVERITNAYKDLL